MTAPGSLLTSMGKACIRRAYVCCLFLYPHKFREANGECMRQSLRDALRDERSPLLPLCWLLMTDLIHSCIREHTAVLTNQLRKHPVVVHAIGLGLILSFLGGVGMVTMQQLLRGGANQPQAQMVELAASRLAAGEALDSVVPAGHIELRRDLQPFVIYYDDLGTARKGTGYLDETLPAPPTGVFDYLRAHPDDSFTWQPRRGVRIATVMHRVEGAHSGFLLAGRSLLMVEKQESLLYHLSIVSWLIVVLLLALGAALLSRHNEKQAKAAAG